MSFRACAHRRSVRQPPWHCHVMVSRTPCGSSSLVVCALRQHQNGCSFRCSDQLVANLSVRACNHRRSVRQPPWQCHVMVSRSLCGSICLVVCALRQHLNGCSFRCSDQLVANLSFRACIHRRSVRQPPWHCHVMVSRIPRGSSCLVVCALRQHLNGCSFRRSDQLVANLSFRACIHRLLSHSGAACATRPVCVPARMAVAGCISTRTLMIYM
jgi:hypothetical protein